MLGGLGVYADQDTAESFAAALQNAARIKRDEYAAQAVQRVTEHFSVPALARALEQLLQEKSAA